jgi:hypothetical protein
MPLRSISVGPLPIYFTNVNTTHALPGHTHYAEVFLTFQTLDPPGFPAFQDTYHDLQTRLIELTAKPFRDCTNEHVADTLWHAFQHWTSPTVQAWQARSGGSYRLQALELAVRGVPDRIGHADGFTRYRVELTPGE